MIKKPKIVVTRKIPVTVSEVLEKNFEVKHNKTDIPMTNDELISALKTADGLLCTVSDQISSKIIKTSGRRVSIISNFGVGVSNIDVKVAKEEKIVVTNTPNVLTEATAEIALFLILAVSRKTTFLESKLRKKMWQGFSIVDDLGVGLHGKTLGIVGMGRIGKATARKVKNSLGMKIIFYNRSSVKCDDLEFKQVSSLEQLMESSDVVSIHAPGGSTQPIIQEKHILSMRETAYIINTARGDVIDQSALIKALEKKQIAGAGLDVFENEPIVPEKLLSLENVTLLPHIGSATLETREAMGLLAVQNLISHFNNEKYPSRVV